MERLRLVDLQKLAESKGGRCLSTKYVNAAEKLEWQCDKGHIWTAAPSGIKSGTWCPQCFGSFKLGIPEMQKLAESRGGKCLSDEYVNNHTKLKWQCGEGHAWQATPSEVKRGRWCPICSEGKSERICRKLFEVVFGQKFPKKRLSWLRSPRGRPLELDGYCEELALAFEYQGRQHYQEVQKFNRGLKEQKEYDELKKKGCKRKNIALIEVPYTVPDEEKAKYIIQECKNLGVNVPEITQKIDYKLFDIYSREELKELQKFAELKGGKCLSEKFINSYVRLEWQCKEGHRWKARPGHVKAGRSWCPYCSHCAKLTIEELQRFAESKGGKCLFKEYKNTHTPIEWQCKEGHRWKNAPAGIKSGQWCPYCARCAKLTIEEMQNHAESKGGKCLSEKYVDENTKLRWRCSAGHEWEARPHDIKADYWCPNCAGNIKLNIEEMQKLAGLKGGKCLSKQYINALTKLKWECKNGHIWEARPNSIQQGRWCPVCAIKQRVLHRKKKG